MCDTVAYISYVLQYHVSMLLRLYMCMIWMHFRANPRLRWQRRGVKKAILAL